MMCIYFYFSTPAVVGPLTHTFIFSTIDNTTLTNFYSKGEYKIAYELFKHNNNNCNKHSAGIFLSEVGSFVEAYVLQSQYESYYTYAENKYGNPDSMDFTTCRANEDPNDDGTYTYLKLGCSDAGGLKLLTYSDSSCTVETTNNLGKYNDAKVRFRFES